MNTRPIINQVRRIIFSFFSPIQVSLPGKETAGIKWQKLRNKNILVPQLGIVLNREDNRHIRIKALDFLLKLSCKVFCWP
jgi:hypothetical protein